eukprot:11209711-Lingulodinium_polyedra.AAC.1
MEKLRTRFRTFLPQSFMMAWLFGALSFPKLSSLRALLGCRAYSLFIRLGIKSSRPPFAFLAPR